MIEPVRIPGTVGYHATKGTPEHSVMEHNVSENTNTESDTDDEEVPCLMMEISIILDQRSTGEIEVFELDGSVETVEFNMPPDENV